MPRHFSCGKCPRIASFFLTPPAGAAQGAYRCMDHVAAELLLLLQIDPFSPVRVSIAGQPLDEDQPTIKIPPVRDSVGPRRRPPAGVRELRGAELLRALADELDQDDDVNGDDL